jgi:hypothetical protein
MFNNFFKQYFYFWLLLHFFPYLLSVP